MSFFPIITIITQGRAADPKRLVLLFIASLRNTPEDLKVFVIAKIRRKCCITSDDQRDSQTYSTGNNQKNTVRIINKQLSIKLVQQILKPEKDASQITFLSFEWKQQREMIEDKILFLANELKEIQLTSTSAEQDDKSCRIL